VPSLNKLVVWFTNDEHGSFLPILAPLVGLGLARTVLVSETRRVMFVRGLYPLVFLPAMMLTQGLFFAGCDLRPNETSPIDPSLLLGCLGDLSGKVHNLSMLSYPWVAISFFFFGWASLAIGVGGSMYALWRLVNVHAKVDMSGTNDLAAAISAEWGPRQVLSRLVGPHSAVVVENTAIAVVGALIGSWLLRQWGYFDFGTSGIIRFLIRAFMGAVILLLMAKLVRLRRAADPGALARRPAHAPSLREAAMAKIAQFSAESAPAASQCSPQSAAP
jgi:uncharacterized membrane protein YeaQ/YmgE (transglycosylase-associated protein family)